MTRSLSQDRLDLFKHVSREARDARSPGTSLTNEFLRFIDEITPDIVIGLAEEIEALRAGAEGGAGAAARTKPASEVIIGPTTRQPDPSPRSGTAEQSTKAQIIQITPGSHDPTSVAKTDVGTATAARQSASGSMKDFAAAAQLVAALNKAKTNGHALGLVLQYRKRVRQECLTPVAAPEPTDGFTPHSPTCWCRTCNEEITYCGMPFNSTHFTACPDCGNKRCPRASNHLFECTNSNEPGQIGKLLGAPEAGTPDAANDDQTG
jgi:hypothetical protein